MNPYFTIFNESTETFSLIWTQYNKDFKVFYKSCLTDIVDYKNTKEFHAKPIKTTNLINISSIPWIHFTSFNLSIEGGSNYLLPIFTIGKYLKKGDTVFLPLSVQVHHAVCDGYHLGQFIESLQALTQNCQSWLKD
jgi:chloramphenicol O-acetyltransferase type A